MLLATKRPRIGGRTLADMSSSILSKIIPVRTKRLMFVSSVLGIIDENIADNQALVGQLNSMLRMPGRPEVFQASNAIKSVIWAGTGLNTAYENLDDSSTSWLDQVLKDQDSVASHFIRKCPKWLKYGEDSSDMRRDLDRLFSVMRTVPEAI